MTKSIVFFQVVEYDAPEKLLSNENGAFSKMIQSTGVANAQYLYSLVLGCEGVKNSKRNQTAHLDRQRTLAFSHWAAAAQFAVLNNICSLQNNLRPLESEYENNILNKAKDSVDTLKVILEGTHDKLINEALDKYQVPADNWWSALYGVVEGTSIFVACLSFIIAHIAHISHMLLTVGKAIGEPVL